ncbi:hypothetical protein LCGC14_1309950 [marine sediment metagenome]|uniref:Uncharacterized protein n=1 Tax=marine sediment metagenome TaxID=412755 RepID=A0A0F9KMT0_9ZZZZ
MVRGRGKSEVTKLREQALSRRGLLKEGYGKLVKEEPKDSDNTGESNPSGGFYNLRSDIEDGKREGKTILMLTLERLFNTDIDSLLDTSRPIKEVGEKLGINESTVSKWRLMRGLRSKQVTYVLE